MDMVVARPTMASMAKGFLPYTLDQRLLLAPDLREWLPDGHLALFLSDVVEAVDLTPILRALEKDDDRGRAGYHPTMMVKLLIYAYCVGKPSSRKIERATYDHDPVRRRSLGFARRPPSLAYDGRSGAGTAEPSARFQSPRTEMAPAASVSSRWGGGHPMPNLPLRWRT